MLKWIAPVFLMVCGQILGQDTSNIKVLAFAGSTRTDSYNKKLVREAADIASAMGATVTIIDLRDYPMPFYDGDLEDEEGMPENAKKFRNMLMENQAFIIASPQYNASVTAVLKNAIDWASRGEAGGASKVAFSGKKFAIMSCSPGAKGGARGLIHLQTILEDVGGVIMSKKVSVPIADKAFDPQGHLISDATKQQLVEEIQELLQ